MAEKSDSYLRSLDGRPTTDAQAVVSQLAAVNGNLNALVHSQLALVEQQRIANLIALGSAEHGPYRYLDAGLTELRSMDAFGVAAHLLGIGEPENGGAGL
jgi:hypothetical protein